MFVVDSEVGLDLAVQVHFWHSKSWCEGEIKEHRVQRCFFWSKFDIQSTVVTLKMMSRSRKSNHFFSISQWCFCAKFVKIH